ncbi:hypothetical protein AB0I28_15550 [Phytomonospora sp. NPDC050363]|uniref:hypothetical protein n=1 Tax=Phytomonospora sp. NPDC050363 TaxID=3155642 RepID=UPI0033C73BDB
MHRKARELGLAGFTLGLRQFDRYLAAESTRTRPMTAEAMRGLFGLPVEILLGPAGEPGEDEPETTSPAPAIEQAAGDASRDHATAFATGDVPGLLIEQLQAEVRRHARDYAHLPPTQLLPRLLRTRDLAYGLLTGTRRPRHVAQLLAVTGQVCGLAATTSFDLGHADAADDHARAAWTYAELAEHDGLKSWVRSTRATIAFWGRRPTEALDHVDAGLRHATGGTARRLHGIAARAYALMGSGREAIGAVHAAGATDGTDPLAEELGGEFGFTPARLAMCTAAVHLALGDGDRAARSAEQAIDMYERTPEEQRRFGILYGAGMDLAAARVLQGELDAVPEALTPALGLDPARRTARLTSRLGAIRSRLSVPRFKHTATALDVRAAIDEFTAGALTAKTGR